MSTGSVSPQLDQFSESSTVVGIDKTREEYSKLFSRATYSPLCDRPYSSPVSGFYDAINTSTRLVLLNYRFKNSHLREQVLPEELNNPSQRDFEYESVFVTQRPKIKPKPKPKPFVVYSKYIYQYFLEILLIVNVIQHTYRLILIDILKGQTKYWHNRRCTSSSLVDTLTDISPPEPVVPTQSRTSHTNVRRSSSLNNHRSESVLARKDKYQDEPRSFTASFCQYYRDAIEKSDPTEFGLQQYPIKETSNQRVKSSGIRRKLPLTEGQQLYLIGKYHTYDIKDSNLRRTNSYVQTLSSRYIADHQCKPQFRLNDPCDYFKYSKFLHIPRSLSPTPSPKPTDNKKPLANIDSHKSFTIHPNKTSSSFRLRRESKSIPVIPIQVPIKTFI